jgi:hypothetical protein
VVAPARPRSGGTWCSRPAPAPLGVPQPVALTGLAEHGGVVEEAVEHGGQDLITVHELREHRSGDRGMGVERPLYHHPARTRISDIMSGWEGYHPPGTILKLPIDRERAFGNVDVAATA